MAASVDAAIAQAAHDTLISLFPSQAASFDAALAEDLDRIQVSSKDAWSDRWEAGPPPRFWPNAPMMALRRQSHCSEPATRRPTNQEGGDRTP